MSFHLFQVTKSLEIMVVCAEQIHSLFLLSLNKCISLIKIKYVIMLHQIQYLIPNITTDKLWWLPRLFFLSMKEKCSSVNFLLYPTIMLPFAKINLESYHLCAFITCNLTYWHYNTVSIPSIRF